MKIITAIFFIITTSFAVAQTNEIDSLYLLLNNSKQDTNRVNTLNAIGFRYYRISPDSSEMHIQNALELAKKLDFRKGMASSYKNMGVVEYAQSNYKEALIFFEKSLLISQEINDKSAVNKALNNIGIIYKNMSDYPKALKYYHESIKIKESTNDLLGKAGTTNNIGLVYEALGDYNKALDSYYEALSIKKVLGGKQSLAHTFLNIGVIYNLMGKTEEAIEYINKALTIYVKEGNIRGQTNAFTSYGRIYKNLNKDSIAIDYFKRAISLATALNFRLAIANLNNDIGSLFLKQMNYKVALQHFEEAYGILQTIDHKKSLCNTLHHLAVAYKGLNLITIAKSKATQSLLLAQSINIKQEISQSAKLLYEIHAIENNYKEALKYSLLHKSYSDSLINDIKAKEIADIRARLEIEQLTNQNEKLENENTLKEVEIEKGTLQIQRQNLLLISGVIVLLLSSLLSFSWYKSHKSRKKSLDILEIKNTEITSQKEQLGLQATELTEVNEKVNRINESLEETVKERTNEIEKQNIKLRKHAFSNAHEIRSPITQILGLLQLYNREEIEHKEKQDINDRISIAAQKLDEITKRNSENLNE